VALKPGWPGFAVTGPPERSAANEPWCQAGECYNSGLSRSPNA